MNPRKNPWHRNRLIRDGIYRAIHEAMKERPEIYIMGEGSHMKVHFDARTIEEEFPNKVVTLPISEDGNSNFAVGMSLAGLVPIVDVISSDFLYRTMDSICNTMAKAAAVGHARTMIIRSEFLTGGPTSGQRIEALFAHVPGLNVAIPSNPDDAYGMMQEALVKKGVTIFFEDRMIEDTSMPKRFQTGNVPPDIESARISQTGSKATVVSYGLTLRHAEEALQNYDCTIVDLRTLFPLDLTTIKRCARDTAKLLIVEPDVTFMGIGAEIGASIAEELPGCKIKRLGAPRATIPASRDLHDDIMPSKEAILKAVESLCS